MSWRIAPLPVQSSATSAGAPATSPRSVRASNSGKPTNSLLFCLVMKGTWPYGQFVLFLAFNANISSIFFTVSYRMDTPWFALSQKQLCLKTAVTSNYLRFLASLRIRIRDPVPFWPLDSGSGSGMKNPDIISESLKTILWVKILNSLMRIRDPWWKKLGSGMEKFGSGINIPDTQHWW